MYNLEKILKIGRNRKSISRFFPIYGDGTIPDALMEDMLRMGTFGNSSKNDSAAERITSMAVEKDNEKHSRLSCLFL